MAMIRDACDHGVAAIVVTHDAHLASWADRVVFLRDGHIVDHVAPMRFRPALRCFCRQWPDRARDPGVPMSTTVLAPVATDPSRRRGSARSTGRRPLGVAPVSAGMASAVPDPGPHHRGGGRHHRGLGRRHEQSAAEERRIRHGPGLRRPSRRYDAHAGERHRQPGARFGRVEVIENETLSIPGSINTYQLRAQDPHGPFGGPMLSLVSGRYPSGADQVAVTSGVASAFHLRTGSNGGWLASSARWSASSRTPRAFSTSSRSSSRGRSRAPPGSRCCSTPRACR